jgi:rubrerythrin
MSNESNSVYDQLMSRRDVLSDTAKAGAGIAALSAVGAGSAGAQESGSADPSDLDILNFALTLEKLEATFYEDALNRFDELGGGGLENSRFAQFFENPSLQYSTYQFFEAIRDHEQAHVNALTEAIEEAGGTPVSGLEFQFPYETPEEFVTLARTFEDTGAAAYTNAAPMIDNSEYVGAAAQILAVEARHASYLRLLNVKSPFPRGFQQTLSLEEVKKAVAPFIVSD